MATPVKKEQKITDVVLARITELSSHNMLNLPSDYSAPNAIKSAELILREAKTKDGKPVLDSCTRESIATCLLDMVSQGLSPMKKQCYFIPYGKNLTLSRSYQGSVAMAKRVGLKSITANVIYEGDEFEFSVDANTGRRKITKHTQSLDTVDNNKIIGAYAVYSLESGEVDVEIMTMLQIKKAWMQGATKGESPAHKNFPEEMAKKSVINRACKSIINSSDDSYLIDGDERVSTDGKTDANSEEITFSEDITEVESQQPESQNPPAKEELTEQQKKDAVLAFEQEELEKRQGNKQPNF